MEILGKKNKIACFPLINGRCTSYHIGILQFTYASFVLSEEQEETLVEASKEESALERELHVDSLQSEELDADVQKPEEVYFNFATS